MHYTRRTSLIFIVALAVTFLVALLIIALVFLPRDALHSFAQYTNLFYLWPKAFAFFVGADLVGSVLLTAYFASVLHHGCDLPSATPPPPSAGETYALLVVGIVLSALAYTMRIVYVRRRLGVGPLLAVVWVPFVVAVLLVVALFTLANTPDGCARGSAPIWASIDYFTAISAAIVVVLYLFQVPRFALSHRLLLLMETKDAVDRRHREQVDALMHSGADADANDGAVVAAADDYSHALLGSAVTVAGHRDSLFWLGAFVALVLAMYMQAGFVPHGSAFVVLGVLFVVLFIAWLVSLCVQARRRRVRFLMRYNAFFLVAALLVAGVALLIFGHFNSTLEAHGWWHVASAAALVLAIGAVRAAWIV